MPHADCPSCGTRVETPTEGTVRCRACGFEFQVAAGETVVPDAPAETAPSGRAPGATGATADRGPAGRDRDPVVVVILTLVTLGIYRLLWLWEVSQEIDDFTGRDPSAHKLVRIGYIVLGVTVLVMLLAAVGIVVVGFSGAPGAPASDAALAGFGLIVILGFVVLLGAFLLPLIGEWRVWQKIHDDEIRADVRDPLDPVVQLILTLIPLINIVGFWIALYRTQDHLNALWRRART